MKTLAAVAIGSFLSLASLGHEARASVVVTANFDDVAPGPKGASFVTGGFDVSSPTGQLFVAPFVGDNFVVALDASPVFLSYNSFMITPHSLEIIAGSTQQRNIFVKGFDGQGGLVVDETRAISGGNQFVDLSGVGGSAVVWSFESAGGDGFDDIAFKAPSIIPLPASATLSLAGIAAFLGVGILRGRKATASL